MSIWRDPWYWQRKYAKTPSELARVNELDRILSNLRIERIGTPIQLPNLYRIDDFVPPGLPNGDLRDGINITGVVYKVIDLNKKEEVPRRTNYKLGSREVLGGTSYSYVLVPFEDQDKNGNTFFENVDEKNATLNFDPRVAHIYYQYEGEDSEIAGQVMATQQSGLSSCVKMANRDNEFMLFDAGKYLSAVLGGIIESNPEYFPQENTMEK